MAGGLLAHVDHRVRVIRLIASVARAVLKEDLRLDAGYLIRFAGCD